MAARQGPSDQSTTVAIPGNTNDRRPITFSGYLMYLGNPAILSKTRISELPLPADFLLTPISSDRITLCREVGNAATSGMIRSFAVQSKNSSFPPNYRPARPPTQPIEADTAIAGAWASPQVSVKPLRWASPESIPQAQPLPQKGSLGDMRPPRQSGLR